MDGLAHLLLLFGTVMMGNNHSHSYADSVKEADYTSNKETGGAYSCRCFFAYQLPHEHQIHHVVDLLDQAGPKERNGKEKQTLPDFPLCQTAIFHFYPPLLSSKMHPFATALRKRAGNWRSRQGKQKPAAAGISNPPQGATCAYRRQLSFLNTTHTLLSIKSCLSAGATIGTSEISSRL